MKKLHQLFTSSLKVKSDVLPRSYAYIQKKLQVVRGEDFLPAMQKKVKALGYKYYEQGKREYYVIREKMKDIPGTNYVLGKDHFCRGNLTDAMVRFKMVIWFKPEHAEAYYFLGRVAIAKDEKEKACGYLEKALSLQGDFPGARFLLDALRAPQEVTGFPAEMLVETYDMLAETYEHTWLSRKQYTGHTALVKAVLQQVTDKNPNLMVLDLGCGTGLCGELLREKEVVKSITGVDISAKMLEKAKYRKIKNEIVYDTVVHSDVASYLDKATETYDVILAADAFEHFGHPEKILKKIARALTANGLFAFTLIDNEGDTIRPDMKECRFVIPKKIIPGLIAKAGFTLVSSREVPLRDESKGTLYVLRG